MIIRRVPRSRLPRDCWDSQGEVGVRDRRDILVSLVGYVLLVAMAIAVIATVMTH